MESATNYMTGKQLLNELKKNEKAVKKFMSDIPQEQRADVATQPIDEYGFTLAHHMAQNAEAESVEAFLDAIPSERRKDVMQTPTANSSVTPMSILSIRQNSHSGVAKLVKSLVESKMNEGSQRDIYTIPELARSSTSSSRIQGR